MTMSILRFNPLADGEARNIFMWHSDEILVAQSVAMIGVAYEAITVINTPRRKGSADCV